MSTLTASPHSRSTTSIPLSRPLLPHSLSLGTLPGPAFSVPLPSGQRSVPANAEPRLRLDMSAGNSGESTPASTAVEGSKRASGMVGVGVGAIGERMTRRNSTYDAWMAEPSSSPGPFDSPPDSLPLVGSRSTMPDLVRGKSMPHVPSALGTSRSAARSSTVTWDDGIPSSTSTSTNRYRPEPKDDADDFAPLEDDTSAALANLRRDSVSAAVALSSTGLAGDTSTKRPMLNRAPGSRDNLSSMVSAPTTPKRKHMGLQGASSASSPGGPTSSGFASHPLKEELSPLTRPARVDHPVSHPSFVPFPQSDDLLRSAMNGLGLDDPVPPSAGMHAQHLPQQQQQTHGQRSVSTSASGLPFGGAHGLRLTGPLGHRQSLPATFFNPGGFPQQSALPPSLPTQHQMQAEAYVGGVGAGNNPGWNPFYLRSPFANAAGGGLPLDSTPFAPPAPSAPTNSAYELRRDSGYGPSPPQSQDLRRGSYSPALGTPAQQAAAAAAAAAIGNQIRRSQSAWQVHEAYAAAAVAAAAAAGRSPSFSFASPGPAPPPPLPPNTWPNQMFVGGSPQGSMDGAGAFGSPLLSQQQMLVEATRRQSLAAAASARGSMDFGVPYGVGVGFGGAMGMPGGYGAPPPVGGRGSVDATGRPVVRSPILEEFRANKHRRWDLREMLGNLGDFAADQLGSRHIQSKLDHASQDDRDIVFAEVYPDILSLSKDVFANYVVQKLFELGTPAQKVQLGEALKGHVLELSLQMYGCRVIQKALEFLDLQQQRLLIKELESEVLLCAKDQHANHVLQRSLQRLDPTDTLFITRSFAGHAFSLATHAYGCRVLQRAFEHVPEVMSRPLLDELQLQSQALITDSYGNYLCQWIIQDGPAVDSNLLISRIRGQVLPLSKHKFASNVVEKAIVKASEDDLRAMLDEVLADKGDGVSTVGIMLKDAFANFPLQKFLVAAREPQRAALFDETALQLAHMRKYSLSYGKYLVAIDKLIASERGAQPFKPPMPGPLPGQVPGAQFHM